MSDQLRRRLWFYRGVTAVLAILLALLVVKLLQIRREGGTFGDPGSDWAVDLLERAEVIEAERGDDPDFSETYVSTPEGSVHLHAMGKGQLTPLHLHPRSDEMVVIVSGTAQVTHHHGGGALTGARGPGSVITSPRGTAHEWKNQSTEHLLFNLVFTSPRFSGNLYLEVPPDGGAPPLIGARGAYPTAGLPPRLRIVEVKSGWSFPVEVDHPVVLYVLEGSGSINGHRVKPHVLVHLGGVTEARITASRATPMILLVFDVTGAQNSWQFDHPG